MLRSFIEFISIYVPRCDGGDDRDERLKSDEMHKGFYVRRCEMCMNGYMVFFFIINIFLSFLSLRDRVWDGIKIKCTEWIDK